MRLRPPPDHELAAFLAEHRSGDYSYPEVGSSRDGAAPARYQSDHNRALLGRGERVYARAVAAVRDWQMFAVGWVDLFPGAGNRAPIAAGESVLILARVLGTYWMNVARIIFTIEEQHRFGFAYGTLGAHAESGEERFLVEMGPDESVYYDLFAFSRPGKWYTFVGYPLARAMQVRFARDSLAAMRRAARG